MKPVLAPRLVTTALAVLVAALTALVAVPSVAQADDETIGIAINPASEDDKDERSRYSFQLDPGQHISDHVWVANPGTKKLTVTLFATDAYNGEDGSYALLDTDEEPTDAGSWITFRSGKQDKLRVKLTLKSGEAAVVPFTMTVPANASPGDHPAGIVAAAAPEGGGQLATERRIAVRLYARVSGDLQPALTISSFSGTYAGDWNPLTGEVLATAVISNNGNVALGGTVSLDATTWFGLTAGTPTDIELEEVLPGNTRTVSFLIPDVPQVGFVNAHLLLRSSIGPDAPDPGPLPVVEREAFVVAVPWLLLGLLLLGGIGWVVLRARARRNERLAAEWIAYTQAEAERLAREGGQPAGTPLDGVAVPGDPTSVPRGGAAVDSEGAPGDSR